jgi:hypothetical protein
MLLSNYQYWVLHAAKWGNRNFIVETKSVVDRVPHQMGYDLKISW